MSRGFRSLLAVTEAGFELAGVAVGSAAYQLLRPTRCLRSWASSEPVIYPQFELAQRSLWQLALDRLEADVAARNAHGVIGVSVQQDWVPGSFATQLSMFGTAVRVPGVVPLKRPFLSLLSMDDTLKLMLRGWVPTGVVCGVAAVHVCGWGATPLGQGNLMTNAEMDAPTAGVRLARFRAEEQVRAVLATRPMGGAVAPTVELTHSSQTCQSGNGMLIECRMTGTVVAKYREPAVGISGARNLAVGRQA